MEVRLAEEKAKQDEELQRRIIQTRLQQRVALSPALQNNAKSLAKKREQFQIQKGQEMKALNDGFEQIKNTISFNVANRPLLLEQVSKAFMHNLKQIKELQKYVAILSKAGMNPDEHLTPE